jgi:uncharacterized membrane protein (DUF106 family)
MEQMMSELVKVLIATVVSGVVLYIGIVNKLRSQLGIDENRIKQLEDNCKEVQKRFEETSKVMMVLDEKAKRLEQRQDSHSKKNDEIVKLINDLSLEMTKQLGNMNTSMVKIASDVENINSTIAVFDEGIRSKKRKSK